MIQFPALYTAFAAARVLEGTVPAPPRTMVYPVGPVAAVQLAQGPGTPAVRRPSGQQRDQEHTRDPGEVPTAVPRWQ